MFIVEAIFSFLRDTLGVILAILLGTLCLSMVVNLIVIVVKNTYTKFKKIIDQLLSSIDSFFALLGFFFSFVISFFKLNPRLAEFMVGKGAF